MWCTVIVWCQKSVQQPDGWYVQFNDNMAVLLNNKCKMLGIWIGGVVSMDLRMKGWGKVVSLAPKVSDNYTPITILDTAHTLCNLQVVWSVSFLIQDLLPLAAFWPVPPSAHHHPHTLSWRHAAWNQWPTQQQQHICSWHMHGPPIGSPLVAHLPSSAPSPVFPHLACTMTFLASLALHIHHIAPCTHTSVDTSLCSIVSW